jgi:hypothetical protein
MSGKVGPFLWILNSDFWTASVLQVHENANSLDVHQVVQLL